MPSENATPGLSPALSLHESVNKSLSCFVFQRIYGTSRNSCGTRVLLLDVQIPARLRWSTVAIYPSNFVSEKVCLFCGFKVQGQTRVLFCQKLMKKRGNSRIALCCLQFFFFFFFFPPWTSTHFTELKKAMYREGIPFYFAGTNGSQIVGVVLQGLAWLLQVGEDQTMTKEVGTNGAEVNSWDVSCLPFPVTDTWTFAPFVCEVLRITVTTLPVLCLQNFAAEVTCWSILVCMNWRPQLSSLLCGTWGRLECHTGANRVWQGCSVVEGQSVINLSHWCSLNLSCGNSG